MRLLDQLPPRDADDDPAVEGRQPITFAIHLECRSSRMSLAAVEFDYQLRVTPYGIGLDRDLAQFDRAVHFRRGQIFIEDQGMEALLHMAARAYVGVGKRADHLPQPSSSGRLG